MGVRVATSTRGMGRLRRGFGGIWEGSTADLAAILPRFCMPDKPYYQA